MHITTTLRSIIFIITLTLSMGYSERSYGVAPVCVTFTHLSPTICSGQSYQVGINSYSTTGTYVDTLTGVSGCDSIILTQLTVDTVRYDTLRLSGCQQVTYDGNVYGNSSIVQRILQSTNGCDSIDSTAIITVYYTSYFTQSLWICQGQSLHIGIHTYSSSGFYIDTLVNAAVGGCDSIIRTILNVITPYPVTLILDDTCTGTYNGQLYTSGTTFIDTIPSYIAGCDSVYLTVVINIAPPNVIPIVQHVSICAGDSVLAAGQYRHTAGSYGDTILTTIGGCDSIITLTQVSVIAPQYASQSFDTCSAVTIAGVVYGSDTTISDTILSSLGCDSLIASYSIHIKAASISIVSADSLPIPGGDSTQLIITPPGNYQDIIWSPNQWINNRYLSSATVDPEVSTAYMVSAIDSNHCPISAHLIVTVGPPAGQGFVMPTAFTPNGDGKNDTIGPILDPYTQVLSFHIYNRWGELVFDMAASGTDQWDGTFKNINQPAGTYLYFVTILSPSGKTINAEGNITLLR